MIEITLTVLLFAWIFIVIMGAAFAVAAVNVVDALTTWFKVELHKESRRGG